MRSVATAFMSGVSVVVVGLSVRASQPVGTAVEAQPAGVVSGVSDGPSTRPSVAATAGPPAPSPSPAAPSPVVKAPVRRTAPVPVPHPVRTSAAPAAPRPTTVTVNGAPADTAYGPVQVQIRLRGGHIIAAQAIEYPSGSGRDQEINSWAIPQLNDEAVRTDSAQIDTVSGATCTSEGYRQSLQSALDAAHRAGAR